MHIVRGLANLGWAGATRPATHVRAASTPTWTPHGVHALPGGELFRVPNRQLRCVRSGHVPASDGSDELYGLRCRGTSRLPPVLRAAMCAQRARTRIRWVSRAVRDCAAGTYQPLTGQTRQSSCIDCALGKYQPLTGQDSCTDCAPGNFSSSTGSPSCDVCAVGTYQDQAGQSSCTDCAAGKYQPLTGQRASRAVLTVQWGTIPRPQSGSCAACAAGTYQDQVGQNSASSCTDCLSGYFSAVEGRHRCDRCELGFHSEAGQSECTRCTTGFPCPEDRPKYLELLVVNDQRRCAEFTAGAAISTPSELRCTHTQRLS